MTNADGDDLPDLLEYALGGSAGSGIQAGDVLRLNTQNSHVSASVVRPLGPSDLTWQLQSSTDLKTWIPLNAAATVSYNGDGTLTVRWNNLDTASGSANGMVRLQVRCTTTGETAATAPYAWQTYTSSSGLQTLGVNVVNTPIFSGLAHSATDSAVYLSDASFLPGVVDADAKYYLEVKDGAYAGHHFDLAHIGDRVLMIDTESAANTLAVVPPEIAGARISVHKHVTLGQVFDKSVLHGTNSLGTADQVQMATATGYRTYWLLKAGSRNQWIAAGDVTLVAADGVVIQPGTAVMLKGTSATPRMLVMTGQVRTTPFARVVTPGLNLFCNPWPLDATPTRLGMMAAGSFNATTSPATADSLQVWKGDAQSGASGYDGWWLFQNPRGVTATWVSSRDATLASQNDVLVLKAGRGALLTRRGNVGAVWYVAAP